MCMQHIAGHECDVRCANACIEACLGLQPESKVCGMRVEKPSALAAVFSVFSNNQGKTMAKPFQALLLRGYTIAIITAHAPDPHLWPRQGPGPYSTVQVEKFRLGEGCLSRLVKTYNWMPSVAGIRVTASSNEPYLTTGCVCIMMLVRVTVALLSSWCDLRLGCCSRTVVAR